MVLEGRLTFLHAVPPANKGTWVDKPELNDASQPVNQRLRMYPKAGVIKAT